MKNTHQSAKNDLSILERLYLLCNHYFFGPLIGLRLKLIVLDRKPFSLEPIPTFVLIGLAATIILHPLTHPLIAFSLIASILPVVLYSFSSIQQLVLEYRAYLSTLGLSVLVGYLGQFYPIPASILICIFLFLTYNRTKLYSDPIAFWKRTVYDTERADAGAISNYVYQLNHAGRYAVVNEIYDDMIAKKIPSCRTLLINMANMKFSQDVESVEGLSDARKILEEVVRVWPDQGDGWRNLGAINFYERRPQAAIASFMRALNLEHNDSTSWLGLGECWMYLGQYVKASDCFRTAIGISPHVDEIRHRLMDALYRAKLLDEFSVHDQLLKGSNTFFVTEENMDSII